MPVNLYDKYDDINTVEVMQVIVPATVLTRGNNYVNGFIFSIFFEL